MAGQSSSKSMIPRPTSASPLFGAPGLAKDPSYLSCTSGVLASTRL